MRRYSILQSLHLPFYSRDRYRDVGKNGKLRALARLHVPFPGLIGFAVAMGYLFFAVKVNAEAEGTKAPAS